VGETAIVFASQAEVVRMRGRVNPQVSMLAFVDIESRIPLDHPLRTIKYIADDSLTELSPVFDAMYVDDGRPLIPPERLLKASLLMSLHSIRSERAFCEQLEYHLLYRWFLGMDLVEPVFDRSSFSKNRQRLLQHEVAQQFFDAVVRQADRRGLLSNEHFTVDGTLIEAAASLESFKPKDEPPSDKPPDDPGNPTVNFHGEHRSNGTHQSTTDPEARLAKKGRGEEAHLAYAGHALTEHRNGLLVDFQINHATGTAEREIVPDLIDQARERGFRPRTSGGFVHAPWPGTRATTRANVWLISAPVTAHPTWRRTPAADEVPLIGAPQVTLVMPSANGNASESRKSSDG
jgi:transposase